MTTTPGPGRTVSERPEVWYILKTEPGSRILYGLKPGTDEGKLKQAVASGRVPELLRYVDIHDGDVLFVPPGVVHTILDGILLLEIGESSESNYRLYDWDRVDAQGSKRELHLQKAYDVIDFGFHGEPIHPEPVTKDFGYYTELKKCSHFCVEKFSLRGTTGSLHTDERFHILVCLSGDGVISFENRSMTFTRGEPVLIPADLKNYTLSPSVDTADIVRIYVP